MDSDSDNESIQGDVTQKADAAEWGKAKHDYYYTDYVDKDYPSKLSAKEERAAAIEQEEALRIQKKLLSTLDNVDLQTVFEEEAAQENGEENLIDFLEKQNRLISSTIDDKQNKSRKRKKVTFRDDIDSDEAESDDMEDDDDEEESEDDIETKEDEDHGRKRRPINIAMKKNRGLTPYKKKEYRNPRVKHKLKYQRAMSKRRRNVREAQIEYHRYSGEASGIKTSTVKSIKLC